MTDRVRGAYVVFDRDIRTDDVEKIVDAIRMMRCVADVQTDQFVSDPSDYMARARIANDVLDTAVCVLRAAMLDGDVFCHDRQRVISNLERVLTCLKNKER